jgi:hypothetical protein
MTGFTGQQDMSIWTEQDRYEAEFFQVESYMAEYKSDGALFKNTRKETDSHPDYTGEFTIPSWAKPGQKIRLASWINTAKESGKRYMSLKASEVRATTRANVVTAQTPEVSDDIPF